MEKRVKRVGNLAAAQVKKYTWRAELLLKKCTGEGTVKVRKTGEEVKIDQNGENTKKTVDALTRFLNKEGEFQGNYAVDTDHGKYSISALEKTKEFGGGGGSAGGSDQTRIVEAAQCVKCVEQGNYSVSLGKGETVEGILAEYENLNEEWQTVIDETAKTLTNEFESGVWHWQDSFVQSIQTAYAGCEDKLAGQFDRYNPADIWYTNQSYESISDLMPEKPEHLEDLTKVLNEAFSHKTIVGISLKKTTEPQLVPYTDEKRNTKIDLEEITVSERTKGTLSIYIGFKLDGENHICQIRKDNLSYRATLKAADRKNGEHYDGSVGRSIIKHCLGKVYKGDLEICEPSFYYGKEQQSIENETLRKREFSPTEKAIASSLDAIVKILNDKTVGENGRKEFLGRLVRYAWSLHTRSCDFLKVDNRKQEAES